MTAIPAIYIWKVSARLSVFARASLLAALLMALGMSAATSTPLVSAHVTSSFPEGLPAPMTAPALNRPAKGGFDMSGRQLGSDVLRALTLATSSGGVQPAGSRGPITVSPEPVGAPLIAASPGTWSALPNLGLLNGPALALAVAGDKIFVGGQFSQTADGKVTDLNNIAMFDLTFHTWSALPHQGLNMGVRALAVYGGDLYVGGDFYQSFDTLVPDLNGIARFNLSNNTWSALPNKGLNNTVRAFTVLGQDLYVGGDFTYAANPVGTISLNHIARFSGGWSPLPHDGLDNTVRALAVMGADIYVGGLFTQSGDGTLQNLHHIAALNAGAWVGLFRNGLDGNVLALSVIGGNVYAGGVFSQTADGVIGNLYNIAAYAPVLELWSPLPDNGLNNSVLSLTAIGSDLYGGGTFTQSKNGNVPNLNHIARYSAITNAWSALPNSGLAGVAVYMLATVAKVLYVGGTFHMTADSALQGLYSIAKCCYPIIEVNQALGEASDRYVAGKDTAIIVYPENPTAADAAQQNVVVKRNNTTITTLYPQPAAGPVAALIFKCPSLPACGDWQAGTYSFDATIQGSTYNLSNVAIVNRGRLRVLAVPVTTNYSGTIQAVTRNDWQMAGEFLRSVYPLAFANFSWERGEVLDGSAWNIVTHEGQESLWTALKNRQPVDCTINCYDKIIGFIPSSIPDGPDSVINGYTMGQPANIVAIQSGMQRTVAHEVGHNFGLGDEYDALGGKFNCNANPPPAVYTGVDWFHRGVLNFHCIGSATLPFEVSGTGVDVVDVQAHPFDIRGRNLLPSVGDFMGNYRNVSQAWVSPDAWRQVFDGMVPTGVLQQLSPALAPYRVVQASGFISRTGQVSLQPWFSFTTTQTLVPITSTYQLQALDALSVTLAARGFDLNFDVFDEPALNNAPFNVVAPFPAGTTAFRIISGTQVLAQLPVLAHSPLVTVTAPVAAQVMTDVTTIKWNATHADGAALVFNVEYNASNNDLAWITLVTGITGTQWTADSSTWAGSVTQSRVRVTASDGINAAGAQSGLFSVPFKAPQPFIQAPISGTHYSIGQPLSLDGVAFDWQDIQVTNDGSLVWGSSLVSGTLGAGHLVHLNGLPLGTQTITFSTTNSLNLTAVATTTVTIDPLRVFLPTIRR